MLEERKITRRVFAGVAAAAGASVLMGSAAAFAEEAQSFGEEPVEGSFSVNRYDSDAQPAPEGEQYGFHADTAACVGCGHCVRACRKVHGFSEDEPAYRELTTYTNAAGEEVTLSHGCLHCEDPACMHVCPAGAISKGAAGLVTVDPDRCIGCRYCYQACPFGVPRYTSAGMVKCDACQSVGVVPGQEPNCVRSCKFDALHFGKLSDLASAYPDARRPESSTKPAFLVQ